MKFIIYSFWNKMISNTFSKQPIKSSLFGFSELVIEISWHIERSRAVSYIQNVEGKVEVTSTTCIPYVTRISKVFIMFLS